MKASLKFILLLTAAVAGCASPGSNSGEGISKYFVKIDRLAAQAGWEPLQTASLPRGTLEIRVWNIDSLSPPYGISFHRTGTTWAGQRISSGFATDAPARLRSVSPKSGWDQFWFKAESLQILTLPDSSTLGKEEMFYDGGTTVIEVRNGSKYRAYHYYCAELQRWPEAQQMAKIEKLVYGEFDTP